MAKLNKKQVAAVKRIIVTYPAWMENRDKAKAHNGAFITESLLNGVRTWARMLKDDQAAIGVEVVPVELLDANIAGQMDAVIPD